LCIEEKYLIKKQDSQNKTKQVKANKEQYE